MCLVGPFLSQPILGGDTIRLTCSSPRRRTGMSVSVPQPWYFHRVGLDEHGGTVTLAWKASAWGADGHTFLAWELRRVLESLSYSSSNPIKDFKNHTFPLIAEHLRKMGVESVEDDLIPSRKSMRAKGVKEEDWPAFVRDEWGVSTGGLLLILCGCLMVRRGKHKVRSAAVLLLFLEAVLPADCCSQDDVSECVASLEMTPAMCDGQAQGADICHHVEFVHQVLSSKASGCQQSALAKILIDIAQGPCLCPSVGAWLSDFISVVGKMLLSILEDTCSDDPLNAQDLRGKKRRRRMDEDMKLAVCEKLHSSGRARNGRVWARATGHCSDKAMDRIRDKYLAGYMASIHERYHESDSFRTVLDGARIGEPASEYSVGMLEDCASGSGAWIPPQACPCVFGIGGLSWA